MSDTTTETAVENEYNVEALDKAIEQITLHPQSWKQSTWRCGSGMCVAGWLVDLNGDKWATDANSWAADYILVPKGTEGAITRDGTHKHYYSSPGLSVPEDMEIMHVETRANEILGLDRPHNLFDSYNSLDQIKEFRDKMANGEEPVYPYTVDYDEDDYDEDDYDEDDYDY